MQRSRGRDGSAEDAALQLVQQQAAELLRFARRFSHCADDAHDAYQRAIETLVRRLRADPPAQPLPWMRTVLRHEALAIRTERERHVGRAELDLDRHEDRHAADPAEEVVSHERLRHTAEALQRLKPQEITALVLRAHGLSYREICTRTGWTYTRTNRAITEGRRALRERIGAIESGAECSRWLPLLSALADGEASAVEVAELRPHLRECAACRATLRDFHAAPAQVALLVPPALVPLASASGGSLAGHVEAVLHGLAERATLLAARVQGAFEALPGAKLAAVAASTAALAGGGVAIDRATHARPAQHASAHVAAVPATAGRLRLMTIALPLPPPADAAAPAHRSRRPAPRGEFARSPAAPAEFAPRAAPTAEFASASPPEPAAAPSAAAASSAAPSAPTPTGTRTPPEFGGP
jgi:RNA polymerase sigma factor (sigma-70 family)